jgi:MFS family permease
LVYVIAWIYSFAVRGINFYLPIHFDEIGLSGFQIGVIYSMLSLAGLISAFHVGVLNDRVKTRTTATIGLFVVLAFYLGLSVSPDFAFLLALFFLFGIGHRIFSLSTDSSVLKNVKKEKGFNFGLYDGMKSFFGASAMLLFGILLQSIGFNVSLLLIAGILIVTVFLVWWIPSVKLHVDPIAMYIKDALNRRTLIFLSMIFIMTLHWGVENTVYTLFLRENLGLSLSQTGFFISIPIIILAAFAIIFGREFDKGKLSEKKLLFLSFIISGFGLVMMAFMTKPILAFIFRVIHEIGDGAFVIFMFVGASSYFPKRRMGGNYGTLILVTVIAQMIGSMIFSPMGDILGYDVPQIIVGLFILLAGFLVFLFKK